MPLLGIDVIQGRREAGLKELLDVIHGATLAAFKVPERDRYHNCARAPCGRNENRGYGTGHTAHRAHRHGASYDPAAKSA
jgi:hypothetical protein